MTAETRFNLEKKSPSEVVVGEIIFAEKYCTLRGWEYINKLMNEDEDFFKSERITKEKRTDENYKNFDDCVRYLIHNFGFMVTKLINGGLKLYPVRRTNFRKRILVGTNLVISTGKIIPATKKVAQ